MTFVVGHTREAANTSTGNQTFTITWADGGNHTPTAVLFLASNATTEGTAVDHFSNTVGAAESTTKRWATANFSESGLASSNAVSYSSDASCIAIFGSSDTIDAEADFVSFGENQVTINWTNAPSSAYLIYIMAFTGTEAVDVATFNPSTSAGSINVTGLGTSANVVIGSMTGSSFGFTEVVNSQYQAGISFYTYNGLTERTAMLYAGERDGRSPTEKSMYWSESRFGVGASHNFGSSTGYITLSNHASGFTVTTVTGGTYNGNQFGYIALALPAGIEAYAAHLDSKGTTGAGTQAVTDPNFTPQAILMLSSYFDKAENSSDGVAGNVDNLCIGGAISPASQYSISTTAADGVSTSDAQSRTDARLIQVVTDAGTDRFVAELDSFDATGFTLDYTTAASTNREFVYLAFEEDEEETPADLITRAGGVLYSAVVKINGVAKSIIKKINGVATQ